MEFKLSGSSFLIIATLLICNEVIAQTVAERVYGKPNCTEEGFSLTAVDSTGFVLSGNSLCGGNNTGFVLRIDRNGDTLWTRKSIEPNGLVRSFQPGVLQFFGKELIGIDGDTLRLTTTDFQGNPVTKNPFYFPVCNNFGTDFIKTTDNGFATTGHFSTTTCNAPVYDGFLTKHNSLGELQWTKIFGEQQNDEFFDIEELPNGDFALFGWTSSRGAGSADFFLLKTDSNGDTLWSKTYGNANSNFGYGMAATTDGGFLLSGYADSTLLLKTNGEGALQWNRSFPDNCGGSYFKCTETLDSAYVLLSYESDSSGTCGSVFRKFDRSGNLLWEKKWSGFLRAFIEFEPGKFGLVGSRSISVFNTNVLFVRFDTTHFPIASSTIEVASRHGPKLYPNPAQSQFYLKLPGRTSFAEGQLILTNLEGQPVKTILIRNAEENISVEGIEPGFYLVEIRIGDSTFFKKLLVQ